MDIKLAILIEYLYNLLHPRPKQTKVANALGDGDSVGQKCVLASNDVEICYSHAKCEIQILWYLHEISNV